MTRKNVFPRLLAVLIIPVVGALSIYGKKEPGNDTEPCAVKANAWEHAALETAKGRVVDVRIEEVCLGDRDILQLKLATDAGDVLVDVAPATYLKAHGMTFANGDIVTAKGLLYDVDGQKTIAAAQIQSGTKTLKLRDASGTALWKSGPVSESQVLDDEEKGKGLF